MVGPAARDRVLACLDACLADIQGMEAAPAETETVAADRRRAEDDEERLRQLMVKGLPKVTWRETEPAFRSEICSLLCSLAPMAAAGDLRAVDAFLTFYERVGARVLWRRDPAWQRMLATFAEALRAYRLGLRCGRFSQMPERRAERRQETADTDTLLPAERPLRVLILAGGVSTGLRIERQLRGVPGIEAHILVCNNSRRSLLRWTAGRLSELARGGVVALGGAVMLAATGRLHFASRPLHDPRVIAWLGSKRFWIGVHAMGVIYRPEVFAQFQKGILNAHIGMLPEYRGRSVMEWSILAGCDTGVTVFFMDAGIDTGREIVLQQKVDLAGRRGVQAAKQFLFDACCPLYAKAILALMDPGQVRRLNHGGRRYYVMSSALTTIVDDLAGVPARAAAAAPVARRAPANSRPADFTDDMAQMPVCFRGAIPTDASRSR
jgi:Formyl transferase